jgi:hypothetical protein
MLWLLNTGNTLKVCGVGEKMELFDASEDSLTLSWPAVTRAVRYELQWRRADDSEDAWKSASDKITNLAVKKRGLEPDTAYMFRVRARDDVDWHEFGATECFTTLRDGTQRLAPPTLADASGADLLVTWRTVADSSRYEIQFWEDGSGWRSASSKLKGSSVRKTNVEAGASYISRVRALVDGVWTAFSPPSAPMSVPTVAPCWPQNLGSTLVTGQGRMLPVQRLAGSLVCLFAAASW